MQNQISTIYIIDKNCFIRLGYEWFEWLCNRHGTKIIVLNDPDTSSEKEMVEDLVSIIHVFSCHLYGLRKYNKNLQGDNSFKGGENNDSSSKSKTLSQSNNEEGT